MHGCLALQRPTRAHPCGALPSLKVYMLRSLLLACFIFASTAIAQASAGGAIDQAVQNFDTSLQKVQAISGQATEPALHVWMTMVLSRHTALRSSARGVAALQCAAGDTRCTGSLAQLKDNAIAQAKSLESAVSAVL